MSVETSKKNKPHSNTRFFKESRGADCQRSSHQRTSHQKFFANCLLTMKKHTGLNVKKRSGMLHLALRASLAVFVMGSISGSMVACTSQISQHGHLLTEADLAQVQVGMSKQQVSFLLGTPDTTATYSGDVFYYISSKMETKSFLPAKEIERRIVAVYFTPQIDTVMRVAHYGLQDGKVIDFISRETPSHGQESNLLTQLFRGLGAKTNVFGN